MIYRVEALTPRSSESEVVNGSGSGLIGGVTALFDDQEEAEAFARSFAEAHFYRYRVAEHPSGRVVAEFFDAAAAAREHEWPKVAQDPKPKPKGGGAKTKPMTDDQLAEIRGRADGGIEYWGSTDALAAIHDRRDLLIEVDRLRAEADRARADDELSRAVERQRSTGLVCFFCSNLGYCTVEGKGVCYCTCPIGQRTQARAVELAEWHDRQVDGDEPKGGGR